MGSQQIEKMQYRNGNGAQPISFVEPEIVAGNPHVRRLDQGQGCHLEFVHFCRIDKQQPNVKMQAIEIYLW